MIVAIDPGTRESGYARIARGHYIIAGNPSYDNELLCQRLASEIAAPDFKRGRIEVVVIEMVEHYGPDVRAGAETFETCVWIGRFMAAAGELTRRMTRRTVKLHLCGSMRAKDADIRQAILDRFGGKEKAVGTKKAPGPIYGVKSHTWAALALALTYFDLGDAACYKPPGAP